MKIKLKKVSIKKQRLKAIVCAFLAGVLFVLICFLGTVPLSAVLFLGFVFCFYEALISAIALIIGIVQERREKCCEKKEQS